MDSSTKISRINGKNSFCKNVSDFILKARKKNLKTVAKLRVLSKKEQKKAKNIKAEGKLEKEFRNESRNATKNETKKMSISKKRKLSSSPDDGPQKKSKVTFRWTDEEYLAECEDLSIRTAKNIIELFDNKNTIPFIVRYRGDLTENIKPDKLRKIKATYEYIQLVHTKADQLIHRISTTQPATSDLLQYIESSQTLEELEFIGSQFKNGNKRSLAQRAMQLGLEVPAKQILEGINKVHFEALVNPNKPGLENVKKVELGIQHIIADIVSKNSDVHAFLEKIYSSDQIFLSTKLKKAKSDDITSSKYHLYGDFSQSLNTIRPHQILAINRGESEKELLVNIVIPDSLWISLKAFCRQKWIKSESRYEDLFNCSVDDAIKRLLKPLVVRRIRAKLTTQAENEALYIFASNLRQLLMTRPCNGRVIMGIDPGFNYGCKVAIVSHTGSLLAHDIFYLKRTNEAKQKLKTLIINHGCEIIALGNGTACRETENLLSDFIKEQTFWPLHVTYTIINEQGISIYSCSSVAEKEFPDLDPKIVSAISLARRLQNPLSELVKVEPKHLGVGMYQHDVQEKKLVSALDDIVSECVSFVGVDINTASMHLLKRVAGLSTSKAQEIIKYRTEICTFKSREDLKKVKGIKTATFQQCAGFIRVTPTTARCKKHDFCQTDFNPLDETNIHPESYEAAEKIIKHFKLSLSQLGSEEFIEKAGKQLNLVTTEELAKFCGCSLSSTEFIIDTIMKPKNFDLRSLSSGPIFRKEIKKMEEIVPGQTLEGVVRNVVTFGAFVDVGVGTNGLIHISQMGKNILLINDKVKVQVISKILSTQRIELKLLSIIK